MRIDILTRDSRIPAFAIRVSRESRYRTGNRHDPAQAFTPAPFLADNHPMSRTPLHSPADVQAAVDALLAENGLRAPVAAALFRRAVSVRRVRERLGGGDHATLARTIRQLEQQYQAAAHTQRALPALPQDVATLMEQTWSAAVAAAQADVLQVQENAARSVAAANAAREDADIRVELLRSELTDLAATLEARNETIGQLRAQLAASERETAAGAQRENELAARLAAAEQARAAERQRLDTEVARIRDQYEGMRVSVLNTTDAQRQEAAQQRSELERHLRRTEQLLKEVTRDRDRLQAGLHDRQPGSSFAA
jgi:chromosome segregation ATPase